MTKRLIVNADDYGHSPGICLGIREANMEGIVTSTTAMMNRPLAPAELTVAARVCPNLSVGVHLVLTAGKPVLSAEKVASLVDNQGRFRKLTGFVEHINGIDFDQVWAEWNAQVEIFVRHYGKNPDHLDSHHHTSYFTPALFERMTRLAEQLHCAIRKPFGNESVDAAVYLPDEMINAAMRNYLAFAALPLPRTTDRFIGNFFDQGATREHLVQILQDIAADPAHETFELMCHPAKMDHELREISDYNDMRQTELSILTDKIIRQTLESLNIKLISYSEL